MAMAVTVACWAGFALLTRGIGDSSLTRLDVALLRFGVPVLVLAPWLPRTLRTLRRERPLVVLALACGAGLPHFLLSALGGHLTSAALVGLVIPGTVPLFVSLLAFACWRDRLTRSQAFALGAILTGVAVVVAGSPSSASGVLVLLSAGLVWSVYTLALRRTALDPIGAALLLGTPSALASGVLLVSGVAPSHLLAGTASPHDVALFATAFGVGIGVLSTLAYTQAVRTLGSRPAATFGAISPAVTALAAVPVFGEPITPTSLLSLTLVVAGVIAFNRRQKGAEGLVGTDAIAGGVEVHQQAADDRQHDRRQLGPAEAAHALL